MAEDAPRSVYQNDEITRRVEAIQEAGRQVASNPATALAFLVKIGICDEAGKLTPRYKSHD